MTRLRAILEHPIFHAAIVIAILAIGTTIAWRWDRWTGEARYQRTDDAYITGDVTPLAAKISGYVQRVAVNDFQAVKAGDLIAEIEPSDYQAQLQLADGDLAAAKASLGDIASKRAIQRTLITQAEASIAAAEADAIRARLEAARQRELLKTQLAGTEQKVEQADADAKKADATVLLNRAQLEQQKALLAELDITEKQLFAQAVSADARVKLARDNLRYTRIEAPADGMVAARQVRPGQYVAAGTQVITAVTLPHLWVIANLKETQMTNVRAGNVARVTVDAFPSLVLNGHVDSWSPGTGSVFALLPPDNATGNFTKVVQRMPVKIMLDPNPSLGALVRPGMSVLATIDTHSNSAAIAGAVVPGENR
jgi:membrane fusion protein (multidrug efflux system)